MNETFAADIHTTGSPAIEIADVAVLKFGGTSVAGAGRLRRVAAIVRGARARSPVVVVVSAMAGVTDALLEAADAAVRRERPWRPLFLALERRHLETMQALSDPREWLEAWWALRSRLGELQRLLGEIEAAAACDPATGARVAAFGERLAAVLAVAALRAAGCQACPVDAGELIVTDSTFAEAQVDAAATRERARRRLGRVLRRAVPVVTGFLGADPTGRTTLLGRGGSDYSAAVLGAALDAVRVEIWSDVPGVLSAPPRWVPDARTVPALGTREATALARWGGKVLHPRTLEPLAPRGIPVVVADSFAPDAPASTVAGTGSSRTWRAVVGRAGFARITSASPTLGTRLCELGLAWWPLTDGDHRGAALVAEGDLGRALAGLGRGADGRGGLAVAALIGRGGEADDAVRAALRARRLPVLALAPRLDGAALGVVVREHHLRRTVKALHDALLAGHSAAATAAVPARPAEATR